MEEVEGEDERYHHEDMNVDILDTEHDKAGDNHPREEFYEVGEALGEAAIDEVETPCAEGGRGTHLLYHHLYRESVILIEDGDMVDSADDAVELAGGIRVVVIRLVCHILPLAVEDGADVCDDSGLEVLYEYILGVEIDGEVANVLEGIELLLQRGREYIKALEYLHEEETDDDRIEHTKYREVRSPRLHVVRGARVPSVRPKEENPEECAREGDEERTEPDIVREYRVSRTQ